MGNGSAKVYVQSTEGIHFDDVAGEDEAKESLTEIVDYQKKNAVLSNKEKMVVAYHEIGHALVAA